MAALDDVQEWLREKESRGVKDVRVASVLARIDAVAAKLAVAERELERSVGAVSLRAEEALRSEARAERMLERVRRLSERQTVAAPDALVGTQEAAELLGVEKSRIGRWRASGVMPKPLTVLASGPVWDAAEIAVMQPEAEKRRRRRTDGGLKLRYEELQRLLDEGATIREAADELEVHPNTVTNAIRKGVVVRRQAVPE